MVLRSLFVTCLLVGSIGVACGNETLHNINTPPQQPPPQAQSVYALSRTNKAFVPKKDAYGESHAFFPRDAQHGHMKHATNALRDNNNNNKPPSKLLQEMTELDSLEQTFGQ